VTPGLIPERESECPGDERFPTRRLAVVARRHGMRFVLAGSFVAAVYLGTTTFLHSVLTVRFQIALVVGFATAVATHFALQRLFVWRRNDGFALSLRTHVGRYTIVAAANYASTAAVTSLVPQAVGVRVTYVYVAWSLLLAAISFVAFAYVVFHGHAQQAPADVRREAN